MDRSSNYPGQRYDIITHTSSHTIDKSSNVSAEHQYKTSLYKASLFTFNTLDRSLSYQSFCHYKTLVQTRVPLVEYDTVDRRESDTWLANDETTALYKTSQTVQMFVLITGRYK